MSDAPFFFCDVDGVVNALVYERVWVGEGSLLDTPWWHEDYRDPKNWAVERYEADPVTAYVPDVEEFVDFPIKRYNAEGVKEVHKTKKVVLNWSSELLSEMRELIVTGQVQFYWLTTWQESAVDILNDLFQFPKDTPFLDWEPWMYRDYGQLGKADAIRGFFKKRQEEGIRVAGEPFVWVDDSATQHLLNYPKFETRNAKMYGFKKMFGMNNLIIRPDEREGINRDEMAAIKRFVIDPKSHNPPMPRMPRWKDYGNKIDDDF